MEENGNSSARDPNTSVPPTFDTISGTSMVLVNGGTLDSKPNHKTSVSANRVFARAFTPKSSFFFTSESQPSVATVMGSINIPHKQSFSTREIREQHMQIQKKYRPSRKRHYTDPVDFEGILNIIGGCSWWQIWVYLLISLQQIPHAMFNLSVVYMMYQPDHWCRVPGLNNTATSDANFTWNSQDTLTYSIVFPKTKNKQRDVLDFHSQVISQEQVFFKIHLNFLVSLLRSRRKTLRRASSNVDGGGAAFGEQRKPNRTNSQVRAMGIRLGRDAEYDCHGVEFGVRRQFQTCARASILFVWIFVRMFVGWIRVGSIWT